MSEKIAKSKCNDHTGSCGCTPTLFMDMIEHAGWELSRRDLFKGAGALGGMFALGGLSATVLAETPAGADGTEADTIYRGGPILTMVKDGERAEALAEKRLAPGKWVIGWGYDDTGIDEQRHPTREDLDAVSTEHPILLVHISGHLMTGNSRMLETVGITAETENPEGGVIQRQRGGNEPNGVLEENAMYLVLGKMPMPTPEQAMEMIEDGLAYYAAAGITTAQDCATFKGTWRLLAATAEADRLPIDVITWPMYKGVDDESFDYIVPQRGKMGGRLRLRLGGVKLTVDGSIQGYTAFLTAPYHVQPEGTDPTPDKCDAEQAERLFVSADNKAVIADAPVQAEGHRGYASMTQEQIEPWLRRGDDNDLQVQVHTNGDADTDMLLKAVERVRAITTDAAWQNFEEDRKGTLEAGKLADLVVLSDDPLAVDPLAIQDIQVMETIKEGKTVYSARA